MDEYISDTRLDKFGEWHAALEKVFTYKKPFFVNSNEVKDLKFDQIYIMPVFAKSGRQAFVIQPGETHRTVELYKTLIDFRQEDVAGPKDVGDDNVVIFKKPVSVFAKWRTDTDALREKCLDHDYDRWKMDNFELRNYEVQVEVKRIITENFALLKAIFTEICAETAWPKMTQLGFSSFAVRCKLVDGFHLNLADVDRFFIAARTEDGKKKD